MFLLGNRLRYIKGGAIGAFFASLCLFLFVPFCGQAAAPDAFAAGDIKAEPEKSPGHGLKAAPDQADSKVSKKGPGKSSIMGGPGKEPTVITARALTADNKAKTALFTGSVVAKKGDSIFYADRMLVYYVETGDGENSNIDRIEATGHVRLVRVNRIITAGKATYYAGADERVVFSDKPRATEDKNVVTGTLMTYYIRDDRSVVENSKIFIVEKAAASPERKPGSGKASAGKKK
jgi:lipopolysaccharide export system protein LptA